MKFKINKIISNLDKTILFNIIILYIYSTIIIWSASNQNKKIILNRILHIFISITIMIFLAQFKPINFKKKINIIYIITNILLIIVNIKGHISKGAQRWINLGLIQFQPSEIVKLILPIYLTKIIDKKKSYILISLIIILIPVILILLQPDLGTAILVSLSGLIIVYLKGINKKNITYSIIFLIFCIPIIWKNFLHNYQKKRILMFLNFNKDPFGAGYHIIQSKIAIGSGGIYGKGFLKGTQSKFNFIPEKTTDFIFAVIAEETGFIGICILLLLYLILIKQGLKISINTKNSFNKKLCLGLILNFFFYILINISMVIGLIPIVGVPLPLVSYGGTSLISVTSIFGILMSIKNDKNYF